MSELTICDAINERFAVWITYKNPETKEEKLYHIYPHVYYRHANGHLLLIGVESGTDEFKTFNKDYIVEADPGPKIHFEPVENLMPKHHSISEMICSVYD